MLVPEARPAHPILLVDDESYILQSYENVLRNAGINNLVSCSDSRHVESLFAAREFDLVLLDLNMPNVSGRQLLPRLVGMFPEVPVIILTADADIDVAVSCMKEGAYDYMVKPIDPRRLVSVVEKALQVRELRRENAELKRRLNTNSLETPEAFESIITDDEKMRSLFIYIESIAVSSEPVLIMGETGTGKELFARAVHDASGRNGPFVPVNVAGLDDTMFSDTLFGHVRGAFTGAGETRDGLIERATGGTLFLDEIGDLSMASQVKLLRFLQEREYRAVGSDVPKHSDARTLVATNRDMRKMLESGTFREDLYFRLLSHQIRIPPLRERVGDLPLLVNHFLTEAAEAMGKKRPTPPKELGVHLSTYHFPGNVRELKAMVHDAVSNHRSGVLSLTTFMEHISGDDMGTGPVSAASLAETSDGIAVPLLFPEKLPSMRRATVMLVEEALRRADNNQGVAASLLGVSRQTMNRYCREIRKSRDD